MPITADGRGFRCDRCNRFWPAVPVVDATGRQYRGKVYCFGGCVGAGPAAPAGGAPPCRCHPVPFVFAPAFHHAPGHGGALPRLGGAQQTAFGAALTAAGRAHGTVIVAGVTAGPRGNILTAAEFAAGPSYPNTTLDQQFGGPGHTSIQTGAGARRASVSNVFACACVLAQSGTANEGAALAAITAAHIASMANQVTVHVVCGCACDGHGGVARCPGGGRGGVGGGGNCCA